MTTMKKPAKLQFNSKGSWKDVGSFDVANEGDTNLIMDAAATLAAHLGGDITARIVATDVAPPCPLMTWSSDRGWTPWRGAQQ